VVVQVLVEHQLVQELSVLHKQLLLAAAAVYLVEMAVLHPLTEQALAVEMAPRMAHTVEHLAMDMLVVMMALDKATVVVVVVLLVLVRMLKDQTLVVQAAADLLHLGTDILMALVVVVVILMVAVLAATVEIVAQAAVALALAAAVLALVVS
jgi:hypothetical protein